MARYCTISRQANAGDMSQFMHKRRHDRMTGIRIDAFGFVAYHSAMSDTDEWMSAAAASAYMGRTDRTLRRYKEEGRLRMRLQHGRVQYHRADLDTLKDELGPDDRPRAPSQAIDIIPAGDMLNLVRELQQQITEAAFREGALRSQLDQRLALPDERAMRDQLAELTRERDELQRRVEELEAQTKKRRWPWQR